LKWSNFHLKTLAMSIVEDSSHIDKIWEALKNDLFVELDASILLYYIEVGHGIKVSIVRILQHFKKNDSLAWWLINICQSNLKNISSIFSIFILCKKILF